MATTLETFQISGYVLTPVQNPQDARLDAVQFGNSLVLYKGTAVGRKTSDNKCYAFTAGASDGTQNIVGFVQTTFATDSTGNIFYNGGVASPTASYRTPPHQNAPIYTAGTFDTNDLFSAATQVAEVDTFTASNPTTGDVYTLTYTAPDLTTTAISATVGATQTATAISALLIAAWNANGTTSAVATASGTATVVLTGVNPGRAFTVAGTVVGTGTIARVATTAASGAVMSDIIANCPGARLLANGFLLIPD